MNIERLKELLDHIGNEVDLLHQAKLKRRVLQAFIDLLEDKQNMVNFFDEYSKKSIEIEQQNKHYREAIFKALDALPVGFKNEAVRILGEALEGEE